MAVDAGIKLGVEGESTFKSAMAAVNQEIKTMAQGVKEATSGTEDYAKKQEALTKYIEANEQKLGLLTKQYDAAKDKLSALAKAMEEAKASGNEEAITKATNAYNKQAVEVGRLEQQMSQCRTEISNSTQAMEEHTESVKEGGNKWAELASTIKDKAMEAFKAIGTAVKDAVTGFVDLANEVAETGDHIDKTSQKIGISAEAYQEWAYICERSGTSVDNLQGSMKVLSTVISDAGNGSAAAAEKLESIGLSYDDLKAKSPDEQLQMVVSALQEMDAGADRTAAATDLLGRSATELGPVLNMTAEETRALADEAHEYGMVMGDDAVKASAAFEDSLSRMNNTISGVKNMLISEFLPGLSEIMDGFSDLVAGVDGGSEKIKSGFSQISDAVKEALPALLDIVKDLIKELAEIAPEIIKTLMEAILDALPELANAAMEILPALVDGITESLPILMDVGVDIILQIVDAIIDAFPKLVDAAGDIIQSLCEGITKAIPKLVEAAPDIIRKLIDGIIQAIPDLVKAAVEIMKGLAKALVENLPTLLAAIPEIIMAIIDAFLDTDFGEIGKTIWDGVTKVFDGIGKFFSGIVGNIKGAFDGIGNWFQNTFTQAKDWVQDTWSKVGDWFGDRRKDIENVFSGIDKWMSNSAFGPAWEAVKDMWAKAGEWFNSIWESIKKVFSVVESVLKGDFEGAWKGITQIWDGATSWFNGIWEKIKGVFSGAFEAFGNIGRNIVDGIKNGIKNAWESFTSWFTGLFDGLVGGIKRFFGISSPSKLMAQMGGYVIQGFAQGIAGGEQGVTDAWHNAISGVGDLAYTANGAGVGGSVTSAGGAAAAQAAQPINLQIDGRTFARLTVPYIDQQQGFNWSRQMALGVSS